MRSLWTSASTPGEAGPGRGTPAMLLLAPVPNGASQQVLSPLENLRTKTGLGEGGYLVLSLPSPHSSHL